MITGPERTLLAMQIASIHGVLDSTRAVVCMLVTRLDGLGVRVNKVTDGAEGGITMLATGLPDHGYASIDVDDNDIIIGVCSNLEVRIIDASNLDKALSEVAQFLLGN